MFTSVTPLYPMDLALVSVTTPPKPAHHLLYVIAQILGQEETTHIHITFIIVIYIYGICYNTPTTICEGVF
jgi:hypothetical protein